MTTMSDDRTPTQILSAMAEEATPELLRIALDMAYGCKECGVIQKQHPQRDCKTWTPRFGPMDMVRLIDMTVALSRHEGVRDRELGLDKVEAKEKIPWLIGVDLSAWKAMTQDERDRLFLEGAIDVERVDRPLLGDSEATGGTPP